MRFEDWPERLGEAIAAAQGKPFVWGERDCALWAFEVVAAMTGVDHAADCRGTYGDRDGSLRCLARVFGCGLEDAVTSRLGDPLPTALFAQRGDVVSIATEEGPALGICIGAELAFIAQSGGLTFRTIAAAAK